MSDASSQHGQPFEPPPWWEHHSAAIISLCAGATSSDLRELAEEIHDLANSAEESEEEANGDQN